MRKGGGEGKKLVKGGFTGLLHQMLPTLLVLSFHNSLTSSFFAITLFVFSLNFPFHYRLLRFHFHRHLIHFFQGVSRVFPPILPFYHPISSLFHHSFHPHSFFTLTPQHSFQFSYHRPLFISHIFHPLFSKFPRNILTKASIT